jgi:hypothetical protein
MGGETVECDGRRQRVQLYDFRCRQGREFRSPVPADRVPSLWYWPTTSRDCECWLGRGQCCLDGREGNVGRGLVLSSELNWGALPVGRTVDPSLVASPENAVREVEVTFPPGLSKSRQARVVLPVDALEERRRMALDRPGREWSFEVRAVLLEPVRELFMEPGMVLAGEWVQEWGRYGSPLVVGVSAEFNGCVRGFLDALLAGDEEGMVAQVRSLRHVTRPADVRCCRKDGQRPPLDLDGFLVEM